MKTDDSVLSGEAVVRGVVSDLSGNPLSGIGITLRTYNEPCGSETEVASWQQTITGSAGDFRLKGFGMPSVGNYSCLHIRISPPSTTDFVDTTVTGLSSRPRFGYRADVETLTVDVALRSRKGSVMTRLQQGESPRGQPVNRTTRIPRIRIAQSPQGSRRCSTRAPGSTPRLDRRPPT